MENDTKNERVELYSSFAKYQWRKMLTMFTFAIALDKYCQLFPMLDPDANIYIDGLNLVKWMDENNNGKLPDNLQILFNEWLLEKKL